MSSWLLALLASSQVPYEFLALVILLSISDGETVGKEGGRAPVRN